MTEFGWKRSDSPAASRRDPGRPRSAARDGSSTDFTVRYGGISIHREEDGDTCYVTVAGELDLSNVDELRSALDSDGKAIHLDTTQLTFIDSTGLAVIIQAQETVGADRFELDPGPATLRILELTQLDRLFQ